jgi:ribosome-associated protein YbcJ (S4-like RNA binding protein)
LAAQPVGDHTDYRQTKSLELTDLVVECLDDGCPCPGRLLNPRVIVLGVSANKGRQAGLVVLTIEPLGVPALERGFQRKGQETPVGLSLNADSAHHLVVGGAQLVLQEKVVLEEGEVRKDGEVSVTEMDKNGDLKKGDVIQMDELNLEVVEEAAEEIAGREPKCPLEKAFETTISFVLEVGISSLLVGRH